jgi:hypothetical protein
MERNLVSNVGEYHDEFTQYNPTRNIDLENVPPGQEYSRFQQFKENINQDYIAGVTERNNILKEAASKEIELQNKSNAAGVPYDGGAKITEIPESSFDPNGMESGLPLIAKTRPGGEAGVIAARQFVEEQFGVVRDVSADQHLSGMVAAPEGRALSASELNDVRMKVDAQLREKGAWDLNQPPPGINPSALQSEVEALKYYRAQIDSLLKQKLESLIGPDSAKRFDDAGGRIGYAKTYGQLAKRFGEETGQAFTPGSANRAPPGAGIKGTGRKVVDAVVDVLPIKNTRTATEGITREVDQLRQLQRLVEMNTTPGYTPAPRGLAQIKASMKDMMSVENLALSLGLIKAAGDLNRMPEDQARKVIGITAQAFPDAFAPTPDRVNVVDEQYQDPFGKETVVQSTLMSSPEERAMRIGGSYANRYVPQTPKTPQPSLPALPATMEKLSDINSSLEPVFQTKSYAYDAQSPLSELEQLTKPDGFVQ